ncbi:unnamed protein product [Callosobruchus maculatus]|uniref:Uncharacterized protein n=1 Tax=Callosobruchus maculatus TaxID=64391 RepID=A0A653D4M5_CALMS|nr:unnamed protein product [Callosobruchus maculatus]
MLLHVSPHASVRYKFFVHFFVFALQKDGILCVLLGERTSLTANANGRMLSRRGRGVMASEDESGEC